MVKNKFEFSLYSEEFIEKSIFKNLTIPKRQTWAKGEQARYSKSLPDSGWSFHKEVDSRLDLGKELVKFLGQVAPYEDEILKLIKAFDLSCKLDLVLYIQEGFVPSIYFNSDLIMELAKFSCDVDVDLTF